MIREREFTQSMVEHMSPQDLIELLAIRYYSMKPEIYEQYLPPGLEYVSGPVALNCYDYAQGTAGKHWIDKDDLQPATVSDGNLLLYYHHSQIKHAGIVIEGGERVISQWGLGPVFKHRLYQLPQSWGRKARCFIMPNV